MVVSYLTIKKFLEGPKLILLDNFLAPFIPLFLPAFFFSLFSGLSFSFLNLLSLLAGLQAYLSAYVIMNSLHGYNDPTVSLLAGKVRLTSLAAQNRFFKNLFSKPSDVLFGLPSR